MNGNNPVASLTKQRGENNGTTVVPGSFNDAAAHMVATVTVTLAQTTDVLVTAYCLARIGTITMGLISEVRDNGVAIEPGVNAPGAGDPAMLSQSVTLEQQINENFVISLGAGTHVLTYWVASFGGTPAVNVFDAQISAWY